MIHFLLVTISRKYHLPKQEGQKNIDQQILLLIPFWKLMLKKQILSLHGVLFKPYFLNQATDCDYFWKDTKIELIQCLQI